MRLVGLHSLTFDGQAPGWRRLTLRFVLFCLGIGAVGVGLLWALVDDEALTMHATCPRRSPPCTTATRALSAADRGRG